MIRYRTESAYGSGEVFAVEVCQYEIFELQNTDIPEYCLSHYDIDEKTAETWRALVDEMNREGEIVDFDEDDEREAVERLLDAVNTAAETDIVFVRWLADLDAVRDVYCFGDQTIPIEGYKIDDAVVLSDLGWDGALYGYEELPYPEEHIRS